jgi:hypothetical protein
MRIQILIVLIWFWTGTLQTVQKRGAAVIAARKMSSAVSAAKAAADHMHDLWHGTLPGQFVSMGVISDGSYDAPKDVIFSFPVTIEHKEWKIVQVSHVSPYTACLFLTLCLIMLSCSVPLWRLNEHWLQICPSIHVHHYCLLLSYCLGRNCITCKWNSWTIHVPQ